MRNWKETGSGIKEIDCDEKNVEVDGREKEREIEEKRNFSSSTFNDSFLPIHSP